tara:strand:+ start:16 stop:600 length:585 start_codon:yes stop_codon:yes gene_type:complete
MNKIILILITVLFTSNVLADHYKKKINIKEFSPKQHCSKKKSLLVPAAKVFPGGEFIKLNSYSGFDQRAVIVGAHATGGTPTATETGVYYADEALAADLNVGDAWNGITSAGVVDTGDDANDGTDIVDFQWRNTLTTPLTITLGKIPTVTIAFGVTDTIGFAGNIATAGHCTNAANATTGLYIKQPDVTITMQN